MRTPDRAAISAWLREYLDDLADGVRISDESRLYEDLGLDSLDSVELAMAIEKRFLFKNVVDFVAAKLQASGRA